jgi:GTP cyclohydrolase I
MSAVTETALEQHRETELQLTGEKKPDRLEHIIRELILELGLDIADQHFEGTPARVARL